nr:acyltransferase [Methylocucumis oryzae]
MGVGFFFILSGFILSYTYKDQLLNNQISRTYYFVKRFARIYPLHLVTLYLAVPILLIENGTKTQIFTQPFFANLFLLQSFGPDRSYFFSGNALSWSISDELFFYLCFPVLILAFCRYRWLVSLVLLGACVCIIGLMPFFPGRVTEHTIFYINPFVRLVDFTIGMALFEVFARLKKISFPGLGFATLLECLAILLFIVFFYFHDDIPQVFRYSCYYWAPISIGILVFAFQAGKLSAFLSYPIFIFLGEISFGFYMFHQLVIRYYQQLDADFHITDNVYLAAAIVFFASVILSSVSYFVIEKPANHAILKKVLKPKN